MNAPARIPDHAEPTPAWPVVDVSIVMPCLNEVICLEPCIRAAQETLATLKQSHGLRGEVLIADNGSTDGSQALAAALGARVVDVREKGYGAALRGGFEAAHGRYLVMGDADGSYDFREAAPMVEALMGGASLCMGSRFKGGIKPGAMPWKNRYIGNPLLTGILNLLFRSRIEDAHCGLRALTKSCFERLGLTGSGMEFASEMVIKAALKGETIAERPATLSPDLRDRPPHLRPWRDGWRHLRYLFMLSPMWLFGVPALLGAIGSLVVLASAGWSVAAHRETTWFFGNYWVVLAGAVMGLSHIAGLLAFTGHVYGVRQGYRAPSPLVVKNAKWITLEAMIAAGLVCGLVGLAVLTGVLMSWTAHGFNRADSVFPAVVGATLSTLGAQNVLGGFLLAIIGGNDAKFLETAALTAKARQGDAQPVFAR